MSVETFDVKSELVTVTPAAAEHFRASLAGKGYSGVRISVRESGCTGFKYVMELNISIIWTKSYLILPKTTSQPL